MVFKMALVSLVTVAILCLAQNVESVPEKADCDWVPYGEVALIRDTADCRKFYYCIQGKTPFHVSCPSSDNNYYQLYFIPDTSTCDFGWKAPEECFGNGDGDWGDNGEYIAPATEPPTTTEAPTTEAPTTVAPTTVAPTTVAPTTVAPTTVALTTLAPATQAPTTDAPTTTEPAPTTTSKPTRTPLLNQTSIHEIDCSVKICGLFPNTYGPCNTFVVCVNGQKEIKKCNGGQLFDVKTMECQPSSLASCWTEPNAGPHIRGRNQEDCPYHNNAPSIPIDTKPDGVILQNPVVTNWGTWQSWTHCPKGMYATGIYSWRRILLQGLLTDQAGIMAVSFICQTPGGNETNSIIESLAPGLPRDGWPFYYMCKGAVVGIRLNSVAQRGWGTDELATDNIQGMCSCSAPVWKDYEGVKYGPQNGNRGTWTAPQYCKRGQAICGMQTQMVDYREYVVGQYDNNGMNNIKVKCCDVPDPLDQCVPKEERLFIRECDNSKGSQSLRCDFDSMIGLSMDYDSNQKLIDFYSSVGYTFSSAKTSISTRIETKLSGDIQNGATLEYTWDAVVPTVMADMKVAANKLYIQPSQREKVYQIAGKCGYFLVRTNRFVRVISDGNTGALIQETFFEL